jgi:acetaldehyde dehydrogenase (acetylating)
MAVGPTCQPTKNKNKNKDEKNIFMAPIGANFFSQT